MPKIREFCSDPDLCHTFGAILTESEHHALISNCSDSEQIHISSHWESEQKSLHAKKQILAAFFSFFLFLFCGNFRPCDDPNLFKHRRDQNLWSAEANFVQIPNLNSQILNTREFPMCYKTLEYM